MWHQTWCREVKKSLKPARDVFPASRCYIPPPSRHKVEEGQFGEHAVLDLHQRMFERFLTPRHVIQHGLFRVEVNIFSRNFSIPRFY